MYIAPEQEAFERGYKAGFEEGMKQGKRISHTPTYPITTPSWPYSPVIWCDSTADDNRNQYSAVD